MLSSVQPKYQYSRGRPPNPLTLYTQSDFERKAKKDFGFCTHDFHHKYTTLEIFLPGELPIEELLKKYNVGEDYDADEVHRDEEPEESYDEG